ncbi:MAG: hypothetical protein AAF531_26805 [Actinomycetota bacterium]
MEQTEGQNPHHVAPEHALSAISAHQGPAVVDFDETLYLRNSTSDFLSSARPALLAFVLVKVIDVIKPWRFGTGGDELRDMWRVRVLLALMPWTKGRWQRQAASSARFALNERLASSLRVGERPVFVSTLGFEPIVRPLLDAFDIGKLELVAMDPWDSEQHGRGKMALTSEAIGGQTLAASTFVTDSEVDRELLDASALPMLVTWPEAGPGETFHRVYYPGRYLTKVKRPGSRYMRKIFKEDIALWILSTIWVAANPITDTIGLLLLALSFWAVYETGYVDNDLVADRYEDEPALTEEFRKRMVTYPPWVPLAWSGVLGLLGLLVLRIPDLPSTADCLLWALVLWVSVGVFRIYNRLDKGTRVLLFPVLQLLRTAAFIVVVPTVAIAILAIAIHVIMRWVSYYVYRTVPGGWPGSADMLVVRVVVFVSLGTLLISQQDDWSELWSATTLSLLAWHLFLARREIPAAIRNAHRIDRERAPAD